MRLIVAGLVSVGAMLASGCGGTSEAGAGSGDRLTLVAYTTPREVYEVLIPAFAKTRRGAGSRFDQSYGSSGEQSRAVESGLPADIVALSLEPDVKRLVDSGLVAEDWSDDAYDGMVSRSVVVLAVRQGNPKEIDGWDDLLRDDVEVITPNPFTSGGARWNVMAAYGAQLEQGRSEEQAVEYLGRLFANVSVQDKSARESLQTFTGGKGDVLIAYENEAITAQAAEVELDYVIPDETILIQNPAAVTTEASSPEKAAAFLEFLRTPEAQRIYASKGYRSVLGAEVDESTYPTPKSLFKIDEFGGWDQVNADFFDPDTGSVAKIEQDLGVSTAK